MVAHTVAHTLTTRGALTLLSAASLPLLLGFSKCCLQCSVWCVVKRHVACLWRACSVSRQGARRCDLPADLPPVLQSFPTPALAPPAPPYRCCLQLPPGRHSKQFDSRPQTALKHKLLCKVTMA